MGKYRKDNPRIVVKFIDNKTDEELFELKDRNWMNIGELFTNHVADSLIQSNIGNLEPDEIMVIAVGIFKKS